MSQPSKILYIVTQSGWGGAQRYVFDLALSFHDKGYDVTVAGGNDIDGKKTLLTKLDENNIKSYKLNNLVRQINPLKDLAAYFEIKKFIKKNNPDILHLNSSKASIIGAIAGKHTGVKKIVYTVHGYAFNEPLPIWKKMIYLWSEKISAQYKNILICVSEFDRQIGIKNKIAPENKFITIHNGVKHINFQPQDQARQYLKLEKTNTTIGTVANFYATKGLTYLIKAAQLTIQEKPDLKFVVIGDGQERKNLENEIKELNLQNHFLLLGVKEKAWQYLPAFDIYVSPSVKEGFPYHVLEAMKASLPIITTNVGGIPEMIEDEINGLLVKPADPQALSQAIIELLDNQKLSEKISSAAEQTANEKFGLEKMILATEEIYRNQL
ncbi:MAG: hypothetical protein CMI53_03470 [Parcubacteria group bacterium]|nr:hypothetical protein [Parcubacteria group bacterium]|tara:strand:+ start:219 stop:1361 length:1143 start_codon:yes stop_codon:yes gene_type:complete